VAVFRRRLAIAPRRSRNASLDTCGPKANRDFPHARTLSSSDGQERLYQSDYRRSSKEKSRTFVHFN
jgi:hypothetical protein